jgi:DNA-directed RNA polymerase specialized sigma24 family protein
VAKRGETTLMWGDGPDGFPVTSWTLIGGAADPARNAAERNKIWETLYSLYGKPLYRVLTRQGFPKARADETVQDFLNDILQSSEFMAKVDRARCRTFRSFLLTVFRNYVNGQRRKKQEVSLDPEDLALLDSALCAMEKAPDRLDREENKVILARMLRDLEAQCRHEGLETHWRLFADCVMTPMLGGVKPPPLPDVCRKYGISSPGQASNMMVTVKRRFQKMGLRLFGNRTDRPEGWREELDDFMDSFSGDSE